MEETNKWLFIAYDLGGALKLQEFAQTNQIVPFCLIDGKANTILGHYPLIKKLDINILKRKKINILIGTGSSRYEIEFMDKLEQNNISYSVMMDNWIYYRERLTHSDGRNMRPQRIYVFYNSSFKQAQLTCSDLTHEIINYNQISSSENSLPTDFSSIIHKVETLIFISQPISESIVISEVEQRSGNSNRFSWPLLTQQQILNKLIKANALSNILKLIYIVVHPSENNESLSEWNKFAFLGLKFNILDRRNITESLVNQSVVVGMNSSLLLELSDEGFFCYSCCDLIDWNEKLPQPWIKQI